VIFIGGAGCSTLRPAQGALAPPMKKITHPVLWFPVTKSQHIGICAANYLFCFIGALRGVPVEGVA